MLVEEIITFSSPSSSINGLICKNGDNSLSVSYNDKETVLPLKEFKLLFKLLSYPNKIFTRTQIMNECWGMYSESYDRTIDVHVTHIREKFIDNVDFSIVTVRGLGYKAVINNG